MLLVVPFATPLPPQSDIGTERLQKDVLCYRLSLVAWCIEATQSLIGWDRLGERSIVSLRAWVCLAGL